MYNFDEAKNAIIAAVDSARRSRGLVVCILGESGIGKTQAIADSLRSINTEKYAIIHMRGFPVAVPPFSSIYDGLSRFLLASRTARADALMQKCARVIPGFDARLHYAAARTGQEHRNYSSIHSSKSSISPSPILLECISDIARDSPVIVVCDDAQWVDDESFAFLVYLSAMSEDRACSIIIAYNERVNTWTARDQKDRSLLSWSSHASGGRHKVIHAQRWQKADFQVLCNQILHERCALSRDDLNKLHKVSGGVPLYTKALLQSLMQNGKLSKGKGGYQSTGAWDTDSLSAGVRSLIDEKLKRAYQGAPVNRDILEVASVIGELFQDQDVDEVLSLCDSFLALSRISQQEPVVHYELKERSWAFDHAVIWDTVYKSLGNGAIDLHRRVAEMLEAKEDVSPMTIAFHWQRAGNIHAATEHMLSCALSLCDVGLFRLALFQIQKVDLSDCGPSSRTSELQARVNIVSGRASYYLRDYSRALRFFQSATDDATTEVVLAEALRWSGRCCVAFDTPSGHTDGVSYLERASKLYSRLGRLRENGECHSDLVVAYAHLNDFERAQSAFSTSERLLTRSEDRVGLARLQRRCVIFMESEFCIPLLKNAAKVFKQEDMPHERIMALVNAGAQCLHRSEIEQSLDFTEAALKASLDSGNFGLSAIYNNLAIIGTMSEDWERAEQAIDNARHCSSRNSDRVMLAVIESALVAMKNGAHASVALMRQAMELCCATGEQTYIVPASVNLGRALLKSGELSSAKKLILETEPVSSGHGQAIYKNWGLLRVAKDLAIKLGDSQALDHVKGKLGWSDPPRAGVYYQTDYLFIDNEFWSD